MGDRYKKHFVVENRIEELSSLAEEIDKLTKDWKISSDLTMNISLVVEEALSNIIFYAFPDKNIHQIKITLLLKARKLTIEIIDNGIPFNPLSHDKPDISLPAEERPVGGLGIFLISKIMDEIHYNRKEDLNILILNKIIRLEQQ